MPRVATAVILASILSVGSAAATDTKILDHHVANMKAGNLEGVLSDYAPDAVVVTPPGLANTSGVFAGPEVRKLFSVLTDKDHVPGNKTMQSR